MKTFNRTLTIAGSDSGGGAGIQADLKTFSALGCYGMSVLTALTAQNTKGVHGIHGVPPAFIEEQLKAVLDDIGTDAVKIGMLHSPEVIEVVAETLKQYAYGKLILDPVMVAKSGDRLLQDDSLDMLQKKLIPMADIITPNIPEAEVLLGKELQGDKLDDAVRELAVNYSLTVVLKGGHMQGGIVRDRIYNGVSGEQLDLDKYRVDTNNNHGTGCTLSSAIAACLAKGESEMEALKSAREYLQGALEAGKGFRTGSGHGPLHHFFAWW